MYIAMRLDNSVPAENSRRDADLSFRCVHDLASDFCHPDVCKVCMRLKVTSWHEERESLGVRLRVDME